MKYQLLIAMTWWLSSFSLFSYGQSVRSVSSPDKRIRLVVSTSAAGELTYALTFRQQPAIAPSALGFTFSKPAVSLNRFTLVSADSSTVDETWKPVWGKIMVDSHESSHPTGLHRTYPNWLASEAARGSEFNNAPTLGINPEHTTILPFTRLLGGPMDFTPGLFRLRLNQFDSTRTQRVRTTLAKQLALFITIYSPLQMAADLPENYLKHLDAFQFIRDVPVDWDDTRVVAAEPGDFVVIARKDKGTDDWFLGAITDENSRTMPFSLDFLETGKTYEATIYQDADNADWQTNPEAYAIDKQRVSRNAKLTLRLATGGGCAIRFRKL